MGWRSNRMFNNNDSLLFKPIFQRLFTPSLKILKIVCTISIHQIQFTGKNITILTNDDLEMI